MSEELLSESKLLELIEKIQQHKEDEGDSTTSVNTTTTPPAAKKLLNEHVVGLISFLSSEQSHTVTLALTHLGDAARIRQNRDLIGAHQPSPKLMEILRNGISQNNQKQIQMVLRLVGNLCFDHPYNREQLQKVNVVDLCINALQTGDEETQRLGCGCIANMASSTEIICTEFYKCGGIDILLVLLRSHNDNIQCMAARAIRNVCETEEIQNHLVSKGVLQYCVETIKTTEDDDGLVLEFFGVVNALISAQPICDQFLNTYNGISLILVALSRGESNNLITDLQDMLNTLSENEKTRELFAQHLDTLRNIFTNTSLKIEIRVCAGKTYANCAVSDTFLSRFYKELDDFLIWLNDEEKEIQVVAAMLIGTVARNDEHCLSMVQRGGIIDTLISVIRNEDRDIRVRHYSTGALRNLSINEKNKKHLLSGGAIPPIVKLLQQPKLNQVVVYQAIGVLKNLIVGGDSYVKAFLDAGGLQHMVSLTDFDDNDHIKFESCRVIALLAKDKNIHGAIIEARGLTVLPTLLNAKFDVLKTEACNAVISLIENGYGNSVLSAPNFTSSLLAIQNDTSSDVKILILTIIEHLSSNPVFIQLLKEESFDKILDNYFQNSFHYTNLKNKIKTMY